MLNYLTARSDGRTSDRLVPAQEQGSGVEDRDEGEDGETGREFRSGIAHDESAPHRGHGDGSREGHGSIGAAGEMHRDSGWSGQEPENEQRANCLCRLGSSGAHEREEHETEGAYGDAA